jgi:hypothetical protein
MDSGALPLRERTQAARQSRGPRRTEGLLSGKAAKLRVQ